MKMTNGLNGRIQPGAIFKKGVSLIVIGSFAGSCATLATQQVLAQSAAQSERIIALPKGIAIEKKDPMPSLPGKDASIGGTVEAYSAGGGAFQVGVWEGTAGTVPIDGYPVDEFMFVEAGSITFTNESGYSQTFEAGDSFVLPKGYRGFAVQPSTFRKQYVTFSGSAD
ncbi:DUF861 domain-containing protein [Altererythrobacter soli]|uniref:DUF861 domain-containing protein n=1 Tax=Croceibacterium soli TaxID=1739690 RepID=A0A6I4UU58_9SPHN|nr:cupin domain-containing protein [Croceibacterium soli]MXP42046.1 DUF861 domain-containing protein [Croceibacterium soli]